jgi:hypothetical protein
MSAAWTAGSVRAKALATRASGPAASHSLAREGSLPAAVSALRKTPYGHDLVAVDDLAAAQHAVAATLLWHLRVLAAWVPRPGTQVIRALAAGFEIANVDELVARLQGRPAGPAYALGTLQTSGTRLASSRSLDQLRSALATSRWGDPGGVSGREIHLSMTLSWADQVASTAPAAATWARAAAACAIARESLLGGRRLNVPTAARASRLLGPRAVETVSNPSSSLEQVLGSLPRPVRWVCANVTAAEDLWRAEATWLRRVEDDGAALLRRSSLRSDCVVGAVAVLAVDAWRIRAALAVAAGVGGASGAPGGRPPSGVFDELA